MKRLYCSICNGELNYVYNLANVPVRLSCVESPDGHLFDVLSFSQCLDCKTIQLGQLMDPSVLYATSHNYTSMGKVWEEYFKTMTDRLNPLVLNKTVLEIGCPSGKLARKSANFNRWYIVEPNKNKSIDFGPTIEFIEEFFDDTTEVPEPVDVIVHSHVFEHIYDPNRFLKKCHRLLKDGGEMVFGVPNMEYLTEKSLCLFAGVFFEHTIFLNKHNISYMLRRHGFEIVEISDYANHSTIYRCKKGEPDHIPVPEIHDYLPLFFELIQKYEDFVERCNAVIRQTTKPVYVFGASYNTQILLSIGLDRTLNGVLDNCKEKQGLYLYGSALQIFDPATISETKCVVILKNGYYVDEIRDQLLNINPDTEIIC